MEFYAGFYEDRLMHRPILTTRKVTNVSFGTQLPGGFAENSFKISSKDFNVDVDFMYRKLPSKHMMIGDSTGRVIWEGECDGVDINGDDVTVTGVGYYSRLRKIHSFLQYFHQDPPPTVTASRILRDVTDLASEFLYADNYALIPSTSLDLGEQVFDPETKCSDLVDKALELGKDQYPAYFAIYNGRIPQFFNTNEGAATAGQIGWHVWSRDIVVADVGASVSLKDVYNKIQILYDDGGTTIDPPWFEDKMSQQIFGVREGSINIGNHDINVANDVGALAIKAYAYMEESVKVSITGEVRGYFGLSEPAYMVRAGTFLYVDDLPTNKKLTSTAFDDVMKLFINSTKYDGDSNKMDLELGTGRLSYELYLTYLGISGGSIA